MNVIVRCYLARVLRMGTAVRTEAFMINSEGD